MDNRLQLHRTLLEAVDRVLNEASKDEKETWTNMVDQALSSLSSKEKEIYREVLKLKKKAYGSIGKRDMPELKTIMKKAGSGAGKVLNALEKTREIGTSVIDDLKKELKESLDEARGRKPAFGNSDGFSYAVQINSLDANDFFKQPFGRQLNDLKRVKQFKETAKSTFVDVKGKSIMPAVKQWVKDMKATEFYASWKQESSSYKDDSIEIWYKK